MSGAAIRLDNVTVAYGRNAAVSGVTGSFAPGGLTAIAGPNGAGKTTLLKALMGEVPLAAGRIDRGALAPRDFGYLPQLAELDRSFPISVADVVTLGAWRGTGALGAVSGGGAPPARDAPGKPRRFGLQRGATRARFWGG